MPIRVVLLMFIAAVTFSACGGETTTTNAPAEIVIPENATLQEKVDLLVKAKRYEEAIQLIAAEDLTDPAMRDLMIKTRMDFGIHAEYEDSQMSMRDKIVLSMRQYVEILRLDPEHEKARAEVEQIMNIYETMPGRTLPADIMQGLRELGIDRGMKADGEN